MARTPVSSFRLSERALDAIEEIQRRSPWYSPATRTEAVERALAHYAQHLRIPRIAMDGLAPVEIPSPS